jgi:hypothetical protein
MPNASGKTTKVRKRGIAASKGAAPAGKSASRRIDERIEELGDWRGEMLSGLRALIRQADPDVVEEWKWRGVPVWSHDGIICTGETYESVVKMTFAKGASLDDPSGLFNSSLEGNTRRAIDFREGDEVDEKALKKLVRAAVALNASRVREKPPAGSSSPAKARAKAAPVAREAARTRARGAEKVVLLAGGNPQIAKADGDAPVQAYIAAMPGWKSDVGRRIDALVARNVPGVRKAVKWNSPFYGVDGRGWFLSFHVFTRYVKVTFFRGASLRPVPPGTSRDENARYVDVREGQLDEAQMATWVKQAAALPGWLA